MGESGAAPTASLSQPYGNFAKIPTEETSNLIPDTCKHDLKLSLPYLRLPGIA